MILLRQFVEVADEKGIARAARALGMSQPALSKNLKRLEETVGAALFERHSKGTVLTGAGRALYERSLKIILEYEHALQEVRNSLSGNEGLIRVGAGLIFSSTIIPAAIPRFQKQFPKYRISVQTREIERLNENLTLGKVDLVTGAIPKTEKLAPGLVSQVLRTGELMLLCGETHPLAFATGKVSLRDVTRYPFISFEPDHDLISRLALYLRENDAPPPRYSIETSSIYGVVELLKAGEHILFGSSLLLEYPIGRGLTAVPIGRPIHQYEMGFIYREHQSDLPAYRGFMNVVKQTLEGGRAQRLG